MIVVDASAVVELLRRTEAGARVAEWVSDERSTLHAPHLIALEVTQALRRLSSRGLVSSTRARGALEDLADIDLVRHRHEPLLPRIWELRENLTAYDAAYVALAEALAAPLMTMDERIARAPGHRAQIELLR